MSELTTGSVRPEHGHSGDAGTINRTNQQVQLIEHYRTHLKTSPIPKIFLCALCFFRYLPVLSALLLRCRIESNLRRLLRARPEILEMVYRPYLAVNWDAPTRFARIVDHCETVAKIGGIMDFPPDTLVNLMQLDPIGPPYRLSLDQARWLLPEGQLVISLWDGIDRIFSLQFCLSSQNGQRIAYIGALQGRPQKDGEPDIMDRYRSFTKAAAGTRPRDFLIEIFKMLCRALDIVEIRAVANVNQPRRQTCSDVKLSYDEVWHERGGIYDGDGFFILPVTANRRTSEKISSKKSVMYAKRYAMLDSVEAELTAALSLGQTCLVTKPA